MAKPVIIDQRMVISLHIEADIVRGVEKLAKKLGMSRNRLMRNLLLSGWEDARTLDAWGLFTLVMKAEAFMETVKAAKADNVSKSQRGIA